MLGTILWIIVAILVIRPFVGGGSIAFRGTEKYRQYERDADANVRERLKNGSGSTKEELQEWWDTYHK
ncbi:MAG: hypothetical protein KA807_18585 [Prolixibacteraceae bacterium]|nr:hypothetical protein [Prolixibacteraceae bacterium]